MRFPSETKVATAVASAAAGRRFELQGECWYSVDVSTGTGHGRYDRQEALEHHHRLIGFAALSALGFSDDETHEFDWHTWPADSAEAFVNAALGEWKRVRDARASNPFSAIAAALVRDSKNRLRTIA